MKKITFEVMINDDDSVIVNYRAEGGFNSLEMFGAVQMCKNAVIHGLNKPVDKKEEPEIKEDKTQQP